MRRFVLLVHRVPRNGAFTLNDLAGGAGRMDEVARAVSTAFTISNDLRRDTHMVLLFGGDGPSAAGRRITVSGPRVRYLNPDERSTAALLKNALVRAVDFPREFESSPGIVVGPVDVGEELRKLAADPDGVWLTEGGVPWRSRRPSHPPATFFLSDPYEPTEEEKTILVEAHLPPVSVGPRSLRTSQVVDIVHHELDLAEAGAG